MIQAQPLPESWGTRPLLDEVTDWEPPQCLDSSADTQAGRAAARGTSSGIDDSDATLIALVERMVDRDERAFAALYECTCTRVHGLVLRITRRPSMAEEVVEDVYWQAWRQAPRFDAVRGQVITWLMAMARSRAIDALRRDERNRHDPLGEVDEANVGDPAAAGVPDLIDAMRGGSLVREAVASLDARARQLIALAFFRGLTHEEIAQHTALPLGTVKSLIRRSLQQLRALLEAKGAA